MPAIIMAAGVGSRISRHVDKPKCLLEIEGKSILRRTVEMLAHNGVQSIVVTGYQHALIEENLKGVDVTLLNNPFFRVTNSLGSLWFARDYIRDDEELYLMNADVFWQQDIFDILKEEERDVLLLADSSIARLEGGDYFFGVADNKIVKYGKELAREIRTHEYVGVGRIRPAFLPHFRKMLHTLMEAEQYTSWWEDVLYQLSTDYDVFVRDVAGHFWAEVDYIEDYERIMAYIYERNAKAAAK